ncbi:MAG: dephospho-CoA kinase [Mycobacteriales bacterium]
MRVGLTGGIGSGKSTVAAGLSAHGALVVDADRLAREVVEPGTPGFADVVEAFGTRTLTADGALDRDALGRIVFADSAARERLNAIVHPRVAARAAELMATVPLGSVVVYDVPLLVENGLADDYDVVVVVEAPADARLARLLAKGLDRGAARARMAAQASDEQRRAVADEVLVNAGSAAELTEAVDRLWQRLLERRTGDG